MFLVGVHPPCAAHVPPIWYNETSVSARCFLKPRGPPGHSWRHFTQEVGRTLPGLLVDETMSHWPILARGLYTRVDETRGWRLPILDWYSIPKTVGSPNPYFTKNHWMVRTHLSKFWMFPQIASPDVLRGSYEESSIGVRVPRFFLDVCLFVCLFVCWVWQDLIESTKLGA